MVLASIVSVQCGAALATTLFDEVGREFIGVAHINGAPGWPVTLGRLTLWTLVALVVVALVHRRRTVWSILRLRPEPRAPLDVVLLAVKSQDTAAALN